ncbi:hypothetical protein H5410_021207 [Solanum commersonii]|uniref:Uncharacterized protein n=1 Tax=Solanum commersonii TaxID=4109 RepID=A0A9J5ZGG7_SOLCO|nr:hypothetical protein H5410_021207 [Solanum commersonii]
MDSQMGKYNSNERNRIFNQTLNDIKLNLSYLPDCIEENQIDVNEWSNYARGGISMSGTSHIVSDLNTHFHGVSHTISDLTSGVTNTDSIPSENLSNNVRCSLQTQILWHDPTTLFSQSLHFHGTSHTVSDFVTGVTNTDLISSKNRPNNARSSPQIQNLWNAPTVSFSHSTNSHGPSRTVSDFEVVTNVDLISSDNRPNNARSSPQTQNLWNAPLVSFSHRRNFHGPSRTVSDFVEGGIKNTSFISSNIHLDTARSSLQMQN